MVQGSPVVEAERLNRPSSLNTFGGAGTKLVARPDILYKEDPIMLARELAARERKFNVAPAYSCSGHLSTSAKRRCRRGKLLFPKVTNLFGSSLPAGV